MLNETLDGEKLPLKNNRECDTFMERTPEPSSQTMPLHSSSQSLPLKTYPYLVRPQEVLRWQPIIHLAWILHVLLTVAVLCSGMQRNQDTRKYIPVRSQNVSLVFSYPCRTVFVNALAESETEEGAIVCCPLKQQQEQQQSALQQQLLEDLCRRKPKYFLFANRLARFPDAWLLPLFPLILRALWLIRFPSVVDHHHGSGDGNFSSYSLSSAVWGLHLTTLLRRFYFYVLLLNVRGWILYLGFNELEDYVLGMTARWLPSSSAYPSCWYKSYFTPTHQQPTPHLTSTSCYGRAFDFSDHIVLYCAQILPIALTEVLYGLVVPIRWNELTRFPGASTTTSNHQQQLLEAVLHPRRRIEWLPLVSLLGLLYLYLITCWGMFKTAAYFHTRDEILVGYTISLLIQIPLWGILQLTGTTWSAIRLYLFALP